MAKTYPIIRMVLNGQTVEFKAADIIGCSVVQESHPISLEVPASTMSVHIYTTDPRFGMFADGEFYNALSRNIPLAVYEFVNGSVVLIGQFYLDKWQVPKANQIIFDAYDAVGVLANTEYLGSYWTEANSVSAVLADILDGTGIAYSVADIVAERTVQGWIAPGKLREALQQVCFAGHCRVRTARSDKLNFVDAVLPIANSALPYGIYGSAKYGDGVYYNAIALKSTLDNEAKTDKQEITHLPMVTGITLLSHDYWHPADGEQTAEEIFNGWLEPGQYSVPYSKPYWKVWATGPGAAPIYIATENGEVLVTEDSGDTWATAIVATESETFNFHSNYVLLNVQEAGDVVVSGYPLLDNVQTFRFAGEQSAYAPNMLSIGGATLVNAAAAEAVLAKVVDYYTLRYQQRIRLFPNTTVNLGDLRAVDTFGDKQIVGIVQKMDSDLSGGYLLDTELVGIERTGA